MGFSGTSSFCPSFRQQDNDVLWGGANGYNNGGYRGTGYVNTFPGGNSNHGLSATNVNVSILPVSVVSGGTNLARLSATDRVLLADATISAAGDRNESLRFSYSYVKISTGTAGVGELDSHSSPHVNGKVAAGGNLLMLDNHVEWRKLAGMNVRSVLSNGGPVPAFWW